MKRIIALALAAGVGAAAHAATETTRYDIYVENGKRAGEQVVTRTDDGLTRVHFVFKDNGRGPELEEQFRLAADGTLASYAVKGSSTFGALVDEHFERRGDRADWHSTSEKGGKSVSGAAMYVPLNGSFATASLMLDRAGRQARRQPGAAAVGHAQPARARPDRGQRRRQDADRAAGRADRARAVAEFLLGHHRRQPAPVRRGVSPAS